MYKKSFHLKAFMLLLILSAGMISIAAQEVSIKGSVINPGQHPVGDVKVYLKSNPAVYCYSDSNGLFQLSFSTTSASALVYDERISFKPDGNIQIHALQNSLHIDIYDMLGRRVKEVIHRKNLSGTYTIHPGAYLNDLPRAIYIAQVRVDDYAKGIKISNLHAVDFPQGLTRISDYAEIPETALKSVAAEDDTLVFSSDFYRQATLAISSYTGDVGVIQLENFGDYTVTVGMDPDITKIDKTYGGFLQLTSEDSVEFEVIFDSASCFNENLLVKAIPISQLDFLPHNLEFISGIHLEPAGTEFLNPPEVWIKLPGLVSDSIVVFGYNEGSNEIYYLPYYTHTDYFINYPNPVSCLLVNISHFSGIGVATGMIPDNTQSETKTSQDYVSDLAYYQQQNEDITDEVWTNYYDVIISQLEGVKKAYEGVNSLESLKQDISDMLEYMANRQLLGVETEFQDTQEYADFLSILTQKINELFNEYNDLCNSSNDDCIKFQQGKKAAEALELGQLFGLQESIPDIHDFCDGEIVILVDSGYFDKRTINLYTGRTHSLPIEVYNMKSEVLDEKIVWISEDPAIASVNQNGLVSANGLGSTILKGKWCDVENQVEVFVSKPDCETEFCKYKECAGGIFAGRGTLDYNYKNWNIQHGDVYHSGAYNVKFSFDLNLPYPRYSISYSDKSKSSYKDKDGARKTSYSTGAGSYSGYLHCSNSGFSDFTANPIGMWLISYHGYSVSVRFVRITAYGEFYSEATCGRIGQ